MNPFSATRQNPAAGGLPPAAAGDVIVDADGVEWMLLAAALPLFPNNRPGKRVHVNTVHRMIREGRLDARVRRQGQHKRWYVRRDQVLDLSSLEALPAKPPSPVAERRAHDRFTEETLKRMRPNGRRPKPAEAV